jgi:ribose transport system substrate-binding protein
MTDKEFYNQIGRREFVTKSLKTAVTLGAIASLGPLLSACMGSKQETTATKQGSTTKGMVANQTFNLENTYFTWFEKGVKEAAAAIGVGYQFFAHNGDSQMQLNQVDQFLVQGGNLMITYAPSDGVVPAFAKACQDKKIYATSCHNNPAWFTPLHVGDYYVQFNTADNELIGYDIAATLFKAIGGKGKVIHLPGYPGTSPDIYRTRGIQRALKEYPDIQLVVGQPGNWNRMDARRALEDVLTKVDHVDGVIGQNDDQAHGAIEALKERKVKVPVVGADATPEALDSIINGDLLATHAQLARYQGGFNLIQAYDAMNGWKPTVPERMVFHQTILTTKENVNQVKEKLYGSATSNIDWVKMSRTLSPDSWDPQLIISPIDPWKFWEGRPVEAGGGLPSQYDEARKNGEWEKTTALYTERYKKKFM